MPRYAEVALPVPLRSTFTYAVPPSLDGEPLIGRRVVVPFGRRAITGVALAESDRPPEIARIKEIAEVMDSLPALPPKLIELGQWISRYYLAPVGEAFRAMLPPEIELRHDREYSLTDSGRARLAELAAAGELFGDAQSEFALLQKVANLGPAKRRNRIDEAAAEKLVRRGYLTGRDILRPRKTRTQQIVAWCLPDELRQGTASAVPKMYESENGFSR
jgi:primosomal protein N'